MGKLKSKANKYKRKKKRKQDRIIKKKQYEIASKKIQDSTLGQPKKGVNFVESEQSYGAVQQSSCSEQQKLFFNNIAENIGAYKLFPEENFTKLASGVLASTSTDSQGESFGFSALEDMLKRIKNKRPFWITVEHNPKIAPRGRVIDALIVYDPALSEHVVYGVMGFYSPETFPKFDDFVTGLSRTSDLFFVDRVNVKAIPVGKLGYNIHEIDKGPISSLLEDAPKCISSQPEIRFRKSHDPISIITISISTWFLLFNPFSKAALKRLGDAFAKEVIEFFGWLKNRVLSELSSFEKRPILELESELGDCRFIFVMDLGEAKDESLQKIALESLGDAVRLAVSIYDKYKETEIERITFIFDVNNKNWNPLYMTTSVYGVISNESEQVKLGNGLSTSGTLPMGVSSLHQKQTTSGFIDKTKGLSKMSINKITFTNRDSFPRV